MLTRLLVALSLLVVATSAYAANLIVTLPGDAPLHVEEYPAPASGPRIVCPPTCVYASPGPNLGISQLRVTQDVDPRNNSNPFDIVAMNGCAGTSALPATNGTCNVPQEGNATITFTTRYRPILAVMVDGTVAGEAFNLFITGSPGPGYNGSGSSFPCNAVLADDATPEEEASRARNCANHLTVDQPVFVQAPDNPPTNGFVSASPPCAMAPIGGGTGQRCDFTLTEDTCITVEYLHSRPDPFPEKPISGPECPTGPGVDGTVGGGGGGGGTPPELEQAKQAALAQLRIEFERVLYPCLVTSTGVATFASFLPLGPAFSIMIGGGLTAAGAPLCAIGMRRIIQYQLIYNDPPDFDYHEVARIPRGSSVPLELPDCSEFSGSEKRFCKKLGKGLKKYAKKDDKVGALAETLRVTVERATAANEVGDAKALKKQLKAMKKRQRQLERAMKKRGKAGAKLADLFGEQQISIGLTEEEFGQAADDVLARLAAEGLPEEEATTLLDAALTPRALDVLGVIAAP